MRKVQYRTSDKAVLWCAFLINVIGLAWTMGCGTGYCMVGYLACVPRKKPRGRQSWGSTLTQVRYVADEGSFPFLSCSCWIPDVFSITINSWDDVVGKKQKQTESGGADPEPKQGTEEEKTGP